MAKRIQKARFDVYAIGSRLSTLPAFLEEISWWADLDEQVIGTVFFEYHDEQFGWSLLARDENRKFRAADIGHSYDSKKRAEAELRLKIEEKVRDKNFNGTVKQYDNEYAPVDLLSPLYQDRSKLHPYFVELIDSKGRAPARKIFEEIGPWLYPSERTFLKEFQCHQFDQRLWELYLWAAFKEMRFDIAQREAPDFECLSAPFGINFTVEATTITPSRSGALEDHPNPKTQEDFIEFLANYMPMKFGSALTSKLQKVNSSNLAYWERDHSKNKPFIIAVADFHKPASLDQKQLGSMTYSQSALYIYLYGHRINWWIDNGELKISVARIEALKYKDKNIPSGFFDLPQSENIAGVLFSNAGTIAKFDRMGVCAGFGAPNHKYYRIGDRCDPDPNAYKGIPFFEEVGSENYQETWCDELQFFHNPNALLPIIPEWFPQITHHFFQNGELFTINGERRILSSMTQILHISDDKV